MSEEQEGEPDDPLSIVSIIYHHDTGLIRVDPGECDEVWVEGLLHRTLRLVEGSGPDVFWSDEDVDLEGDDDNSESG